MNVHALHGCWFSHRPWEKNAKLSTNHFNHLTYLLHFYSLGFPLSKQIFYYLIMHLTDVQINLGIFIKRLVFLWSHFTPPSSSFSNQFNSKLWISWSILSHSLWGSIINSSQLFMSPFSTDPLRNCLFRLINNCDCYKFTATPSALNIHLESWPPAAISLSLCLSFTENHSSFHPLFHTLCFSQVWLKKTETAYSQRHPEVNLHFMPTQALALFNVLVNYHIKKSCDKQLLAHFKQWWQNGLIVCELSVFLLPISPEITLINCVNIW